MSASGNKPGEAGSGKPPAKNDDKSKKSPAQVSEDDDVEDGDIATPKRDRDDEQQGL
jgi:hypothetical protein